MSTIETIERDFKEKVCDKLRLASEGVNRYRVFTPFMFEDGDHLSIILEKRKWEMGAIRRRAYLYAFDL